MNVLRVCIVAVVGVIGAASSAGRAQSLPHIDAVIEEMELAVLAGDPAAYLRHVAPTECAGCDAFFRAEQEAWAADLAKVRPVKFELSASEPREREDGGVAVMLVMEYAMPEGPAKKGARAEWTGVFRRHGDDGKSGEVNGDRWLYHGEPWLVLEREGFVVKYEPGFEEVAEEAAAAFPVSKSHADEGFGITNAKPQQIKLYHDMEHLKASVYLSMPDSSLGGWNEPGESIKFMTWYTRGEGWKQAFAHEYAHVATWEMGPRARQNMPWWMAEGVAELSAERFRPGYVAALDKMMRDLAASNALVAWQEIIDYQTAAQRVKQMAYMQGHHLMGYVSERFGREGRNAWIREVAAGKTLDEATRGALGTGFAELDAAWRESLKER
ncbi:MAG: hypothetical protein H7Y88_07820 [Phycisphaerales bacterium]|nr:hypothetical protein [Phycisphaerales bacterium]